MKLSRVKLSQASLVEIKVTNLEHVVRTEDGQTVMERNLRDLAGRRNKREFNTITCTEVINVMYVRKEDCQ